MAYVLAGIGIIIGVILIVVGAELVGILELVLVILGGGAAAIAEKS